MKMNSNYEFIIPLTKEELKENLKTIRSEKWINTHLDKYLYFLQLVYIGNNRKDSKKDEYTRIKSTDLQKFLGARYYPIIQQDLIDLKIIDEIDNYSHQLAGNSKTNGYKLKPEYNNKFFINSSDTNSALIQKINADSINKIDDSTDLKKRLARTLNELYIEDSDFQNLTPNQKKQYFCLKNNKYQNEGGKSKRIYNNFTNIDKDLRKLLKIRGESLVFVDIVNSQMVFCAEVIKERCIQNNLPISKETEDFAELTATGIFYNLIMEYTGITDRNKAKEAIFKIVYGFSYAKKSKLLKKLSTKFPQVVEVMESIKNEYGYEKFSHLLQDKEADIVFEAVNSIQYDKEIETIHDSLYAAKSELQTIIDALVSSFRNNGIQATINVNDQYYLNTHTGEIKMKDIQPKIKTEDRPANQPTTEEKTVSKKHTKILNIKDIQPKIKTEDRPANQPTTEEKEKEFIEFVKIEKPDMVEVFQNKGVYNKIYLLRNLDKNLKDITDEDILNIKKFIYNDYLVDLGNKKGTSKKFNDFLNKNIVRNTSEHNMTDLFDLFQSFKLDKVLTDFPKQFNY